MRFRASGSSGRLLRLNWAVDNHMVTNGVVPNLCTCWHAALFVVLVQALGLPSLGFLFSVACKVAQLPDSMGASLLLVLVQVLVVSSLRVFPPVASLLQCIHLAQVVQA